LHVNFQAKNDRQAFMKMARINIFETLAFITLPQKISPAEQVIKFSCFENEIYQTY
jgi:hypothetical protein